MVLRGLVLLGQPEIDLIGQVQASLADVLGLRVPVDADHLGLTFSPTNFTDRHNITSFS